jgi:hypothetical protein
MGQDARFVDARPRQIAQISAFLSNVPFLPHKNAGGLRKMRFDNRFSDRGKSGAFSVCYVYFEEQGVVVLTTIFGKNEKGDLSPADRDGSAAVIRVVEHDLAAEG